MAKSPNLTALPQALAEARRKRRLSVAAAAASLSVPVPTYRNWAYGVSLPKEEAFDALCSHLRIDRTGLESLLAPAPADLSGDPLAKQVLTADPRSRSVIRAVLAAQKRHPLKGADHG